MSNSKSSNNLWLTQLTDHLKNERHSRCVAQNYSAAVKRFLAHLEKRGVTVESVQLSDVEHYLAALRLSRKFRSRRSRATPWLRRLHRSAIHMLLRLVHGEWPVVKTPPTARELLHHQIVSEYDAWMSELRGLAAETRADRCAEARRFLKWLEENGKDELAAIAVADIDAYVRTHGASVRRTTCKGMTVKLRSFLRHLHLSGNWPGPEHSRHRADAVRL